MDPAINSATSLAPLSFPSARTFLAAAKNGSETEAPPAPPQTEPDTKPDKPAPAPPKPPPSTEPETEPDRITPTQPVEEPSPDDLPDRTHTTCPVYPRIP